MFLDFKKIFDKILQGGEDSTGSEHTIDGIHSPLEMHLVHYNCKFGSLYDAVKEGGNPQLDPHRSRTLAVIGVLFQV